MSIRILYDGTFKGLFSAIFYCYEQKLVPESISAKNNSQSSLFSNTISIQTDVVRSKRILVGLHKRINKRGLEKLYKAFCSELPEREMLIWSYSHEIFCSSHHGAQDFRNQVILRLNQVVKMVNREIHRMHAFVRFKKTKDDIYAATIRPDFDVLTLSAKHFKARYQDQQWMIYDVKRDYGIYYNLDEMRTIKLEDPEWTSNHQFKSSALSNDEKSFQRMWRQYFESTCTDERKNIKLHLKHIPSRYWKFLPEKTITLQ
jgi:probable DNA metabolism protein